jgi:hypothetical protein
LAITATALLSGCKVGLVLIFNAKWCTDRGILRRVNGFTD